MKCKYCDKRGQYHISKSSIVCADHWLLIVNCTKIPNHIPDGQSMIYLRNYYDKEIRPT
jgi:hypothetical protein